MMSSIFHRISVRKFEDRPIEKEKIVQVLKAGMQAPSACNQQPWEFYVVTDKEKIQELSTATPYSKCAAGAPVVIVPVYRTEGQGAGGSGSFPASDGIGIAVGCYFCSGTGCQRTADAFDVRQG